MGKLREPLNEMQSCGLPAALEVMLNGKSIDQVLDKLEAQLKRMRERHKERRRAGRSRFNSHMRFSFGPGEVVLKEAFARLERLAADART